MKHSYNRHLFAIAFGVLALSACTAGSSATTSATTGNAPAVAAHTASKASSPVASVVPGDAAVRKAVQSLVKGAKISSVRTSPIDGLLEVVADGQTIYVSSDGKYLVSGNIIDVASKTDLTEVSRAVSRRSVLKDLVPSQMIVFAPPNPKYTVTVFTDVDCGYCRKLHSQIADYNKAGIAVDYLFFPRTGLGSESYDKAVSVWCAADRRKALTDAKNGLPVPKVDCKNPVTMDYNLGLRIGVDGTPAIYAADGTQLGGYLPPTEMRAKLDELAAKPNS